MDQLLRVFVGSFVCLFVLLMPIFSVFRFVKDFKRTNKRFLGYGFALLVICGYLILQWLNRHEPTPVGGLFFVVFEVQVCFEVKYAKGGYVIDETMFFLKLELNIFCYVFFYMERLPKLPVRS